MAFLTPRGVAQKCALIASTWWSTSTGPIGMSVAVEAVSFASSSCSASYNPAGGPGGPSTEWQAAAKTFSEKFVLAPTKPDGQCFYAALLSALFKDTKSIPKQDRMEMVKTLIGDAVIPASHREPSLHDFLRTEGERAAWYVGQYETCVAKKWPANIPECGAFKTLPPGAGDVVAQQNVWLSVFGDQRRGTQFVEKGEAVPVKETLWEKWMALMRVQVATHLLHTEGLAMHGTSARNKMVNQLQTIVEVIFGLDIQNMDTDKDTFDAQTEAVLGTEKAASAEAAEAWQAWSVFHMIAWANTSEWKQLFPEDGLPSMDSAAAAFEVLLGEDTTKAFEAEMNLIPRRRDVNSRRQLTPEEQLLARQEVMERLAKALEATVLDAERDAPGVFVNLERTKKWFGEDGVDAIRNHKFDVTHLFDFTKRFFPERAGAAAPVSTSASAFPMRWGFWAGPADLLGGGADPMAYTGERTIDVIPSMLGRPIRVYRFGDPERDVFEHVHTKHLDSGRAAKEPVQVAMVTLGWMERGSAEVRANKEGAVAAMIDADVPGSCGRSVHFEAVLARSAYDAAMASADASVQVLGPSVERVFAQPAFVDPLTRALGLAFPPQAFHPWELFGTGLSLGPDGLFRKRTTDLEIPDCFLADGSTNPLLAKRARVEPAAPPAQRAPVESPAPIVLLADGEDDEDEAAELAKAIAMSMQ